MAYQNFFEKHSKLFTIILVMMIFVGMDLLFGRVYKVIFGHSWASAPLNRNIIGEKSYRVHSDIYHHGLTPNVNLMGFWGVGRYPFATDSLGFKNFAPQEIPLRSQNHRILLIGDSFTEGVGLSYADTFAGMLSQDLAKDHVEILNAAAVSYSPIIYWRKIKYLIEDVKLRFDEVVVFIDLSDLRDEFHGYYIDEKDAIRELKHENELIRSEAPTGFFYENSIVLLYIYQSFFRNLDHVVKRVFISQSHGRLNKGNIAWSVDHEEFKIYGGKGFRQLEKNMDRLRLLLKEHDIPLTLAVYPWPDQIAHNDLNSIQVRFWKDWCRRHNIAFLNFFPDFVKEANTQEDHTRILSQYFIKGDAHWNKAGHRVIADHFLSFYHSRTKAGAY